MGVSAIKLRITSKLLHIKPQLLYTRIPQEFWKIFPSTDTCTYEQERQCRNVKRAKVRGIITTFHREIEE